MLKRFLKWILVLILLLAAVIVSIGWLLSSRLPVEVTRQFEPLPYFVDDQFINQERQAPYELSRQSLQRQFFGDEQRQPHIQPPVVPIDAERFKRPASIALTVNWLGHSSVLLEFDGYRIMVDPVFSERASPFQFMGPKRFHPPPVDLEDVTNVDAVVVSHNHYDHFDKASIQHLARQGATILVPLGVSERLKDWQVPSAQVKSLQWWDEVSIGDLRVIATPTRHYSGRGLFDYKQTHWASWSLVGPTTRVFYSGDTGYSTLFRQIGEKLGPFDLTLVKVGSYGPGKAWQDIHMLPENSVRTHQDVEGKTMLPLHWATFNLAMHDWDEPVIRTIAAAESARVKLITPRIGETVSEIDSYQNQPWWQAVNCKAAENQEQSLLNSSSLCADIE